MWTTRNEKLTTGRELRFFIELDTKPATFRDVLRGWQDDAEFRAIFNALLAEAPFAAFRWETPPVTPDTVSRPFEFVLLDSPMLARRPPDPAPFAEHFKQSPDKPVLVFPNLGKDAIMVVPRLQTTISAYGHLATFVRQAPEAQRHTLWQVVGETMTRRLAKPQPVWLSTAGGGVDWLHVRLDDRPKYYGFAPYRQMD